MSASFMHRHVQMSDRCMQQHEQVTGSFMQQYVQVADSCIQWRVQVSNGCIQRHAQVSDSCIQLCVQTSDSYITNVYTRVHISQTEEGTYVHLFDICIYIQVSNSCEHQYTMVPVRWGHGTEILAIFETSLQIFQKSTQLLICKITETIQIVNL